MSSKNSLDNLECYQLGLALAVEIHRVTQSLAHRRHYHLSDQLRRAGISIPANIAEGYGRSTAKEFARFIAIARGSAYEVQTLLRLCSKLGYLNEAEHAEIQDLVSIILGKLTAFHRYLRTSKAPYLS
jgi:four helix bundle protein